MCHLQESDRWLESPEQVGIVGSGCDSECLHEIEKITIDSVSDVQQLLHDTEDRFVEFHEQNIQDIGEKEKLVSNTKPDVSSEEDIADFPLTDTSAIKSEATDSHLGDFLPVKENVVSQAHTIIFSREPSFIYDTSVEAFGNMEADSVDDLDLSFNRGLEEEIEENDEIDITESNGISVIGKLVLSVDDDSAKSDCKASSKSPLTTRVAVADISCTAEQQLDNFKQFISAAVPVDYKGKTSKHHYQSASDIGGESSVEEKEVNKISSTPEGEAYFYRREQSFIKKVEQGKIGQLAVVIADRFLQKTESNNEDYICPDVLPSDHELSVKPVLASPEAEIEITNTNDLADQVLDLTVKPIIRPSPTGLLSSYESIYDRLILEEEEVLQSDLIEGKEKEVVLRQQSPAATNSLVLGDQFNVTQRQLPDWAGSSFEELFDRSAGELANSILTEATLAVASEPFERWSAPPGVLEPPMLEAGEFFVRFDPVQEKIEGHWQELEILMMEEDQKGEKECRGSEL
jgi:hypothetical protein